MRLSCKRRQWQLHGSIATHGKAARQEVVVDEDGCKLRLEVRIVENLQFGTVSEDYENEVVWKDRNGNMGGQNCRACDKWGCSLDRDFCRNSCKQDTSFEKKPSKAPLPHSRKRQQCFAGQDQYYAARNDYTNNSETILLCNRCVCVIGKLIPRQLMCVIGAFTESALCKRPKLHKRTPARTPCVTDVLCNWEINSQIIKMCV